MRLYPDYREQITCLPLDGDLVTILSRGGGAERHCRGHRHRSCPGQGHDQPAPSAGGRLGAVAGRLTAPSGSPLAYRSAPNARERGDDGQTPLHRHCPTSFCRLLRRLRLPYVRRAAPGVIATATKRRSACASARPGCPRARRSTSGSRIARRSRHSPSAPCARWSGSTVQRCSVPAARASTFHTALLAVVIGQTVERRALDLNPQAFSPSVDDLDGGQLATLDLMQNGLTGTPQPRGGVIRDPRRPEQPPGSPMPPPARGEALH